MANPFTSSAESADNGWVIPFSRTLWVGAAAVAAAGLGGGPVAAQAAPAAPQARFEVRLETGLVPEAYRGNPARLVRALQRDARTRQGVFARQARGRGVKVTRRFWITNTVVVTATPDGVRWLRRSPLVAEVSRVRAGGRVPPLGVAPRRAARVRQMAVTTTFENITLTGAPVLWAQGTTGTGMRVGVMDTELDAGHPVFGCTSGQSWTQSTKCGRVVGYGNFTTSTPFTHDPGEDAFSGRAHGTKVTSVLAGGTAGTPARTWGVAPDAQILFARIVNSEGAFDGLAELAAAQWFADPDGNPATNDQPAVVNGSFGGFDGNHPIDQSRVLVRTLVAADIVPVFAAGNVGLVWVALAGRVGWLPRRGSRRRCRWRTPTTRMWSPWIPAGGVIQPPRTPSRSIRAVARMTAGTARGPRRGFRSSRMCRPPGWASRPRVIAAMSTTA